MDWEETETIEQQPLPVITVILVLINVGAYLYTEWKGSSLDAEFMIDMGAMYEPAFVEGHEYYRIITHFFLHFGLEHLVNNMIALLVLGYTLEQDIGRIRYLILYMLSGILSGFVSVYVNWSLGENVVSCGASGAIYGLVGALLMVLLKNRKQIVRGDIIRFECRIAELTIRRISAELWLDLYYAVYCIKERIKQILELEATDAGKYLLWWKRADR